VLETVFDLDKPALAFELRHTLIEKIWPGGGIAREAECASPVFSTGCNDPDRGQTKSFEPSASGTLGLQTAAADNDFAVLDAAQFARRLVEPDRDAAVDKP
jgi:hypothetical protein